MTAQEAGLPTSRANLHTGQTDPKMEHVIVRTACSLLNHEGGTLLVGVADDGTVPGIESDLETLDPTGGANGYELQRRTGAGHLPRSRSRTRQPGLRPARQGR
jgi:hypothetical protein